MDEHSRVTVDSDHPVPKHLSLHPRSWALLVLAGLVALLGLLTLALTF